MVKRTGETATKQKRPDLGARWSREERAEIDALAQRKGVKPTQIIRMAVRRYIDEEKRK